MKWGRHAAAIAALAGMTLAAPLPAAANTADAEKLRRLDIMLMVSALRCRNGASDFQADYNRFAARHLVEMNAASRELKAQYAARYGAQGAKRALDRISVSMANQYGRGHPWMDCAELKDATQRLALLAPGPGLGAAADKLLGDAPEGRRWLAANY